MNYLAHCYLSCQNEEVLVGNFITDFIRKKDEDRYEGDIRLGIRLHREIDRFTDDHPISREMRSILRTRHNKYAPVMVDLLCDYYLSKNWSHFSGQTLRAFADQSYETFHKYEPIFPDVLRSRFPGMYKADFLLAYSDIHRTERSLIWMDDRAKFPSRFKDGIIDIRENDERFNDLFLELFPDVIGHSEMICDC